MSYINNKYQRIVQSTSEDKTTEHKFHRYFNITHLSIKHEPKSYVDFSAYANSQTNYYSYSDRDEIVEIEMPKKSWEELMRYYRMNEKAADLESYEYDMRKKYPAIKDAHEKYLMLMELYR